MEHELDLSDSFGIVAGAANIAQCGVHARLKQLPKMKKCSLSKEREKGLSEPNITLAELITMVQGESMAGSSVTDGDVKVHKMYNPRRDSIIRQVTLRAKSNPAGTPLLAWSLGKQRW